MAHFDHLARVYAELTAVPLEFVVPLPPDTPLDIAAAVAMSGTTAYVLTSAAQRVGPGDVVVVHAAAGATGGALGSASGWALRTAESGTPASALPSRPATQMELRSSSSHHPPDQAGSTAPTKRYLHTYSPPALCAE